MSNNTIVQSNGTIRVRLGDKNGTFAVAYKKDGNPDNPQIKREVNGVYINLPVTTLAQVAAFQEYKTEYDVYDSDGRKIGTYELQGALAACAEKFKHSAESVRGEIRTALEAGMALSDTTIQARFNDYTGPSGRRGGFTKQVTVDGGELERLMAAGDLNAVKDYLAKQGAKVA
jgi:hypothetical protein